MLPRRALADAALALVARVGPSVAVRVAPTPRSVGDPSDAVVLLVHLILSAPGLPGTVSTLQTDQVEVKS